MDRNGRKPQVNMVRHIRRRAPFHPMKRGVFIMKTSPQEGAAKQPAPKGRQ